ncbi:3-oxoadipate enol-lactonase [Yangia mangrovi]|uniref:3-oxoadipate enol-lactonase n=1 Tax=Alloyangia mangrovi TaxID=1779329 RepID=A0ABT2KRZ0_9RHOB|nr:3-oxoadipate enol-lactonase [Alloyangia mangrovi]MCA0939162.1 3-oxoadipate enol-lactonase [Alloyangia pacifica]MCA0947639.1 3-oxoadipate enol-lactonase [Alloyangia pacifica]MCT4372962.1 3-oxoadipate enol-lactonase [Alloyangia mangrovi]
MLMADLGDVRLHYRIDGPEEGAPLVLANSLGTDFRLWDGLLPHLPEGLRILRYDMRGHGLSDCPEPPYSMGALVRDAERLMEQTGFRDAVFVGLSIGGMVAQGLSAKRHDLVRAAVLSNTAAKIGTRQIWEARIAEVAQGGVEAIADAVLERWFTRNFRTSEAIKPWRNMLTRTPKKGYMGCAAAIAGTDFLTPTSGLRLPLLGIAATEDGSTPPDMVRETTDLVPGSQFALIRGAGHLPFIEKPAEYGRILTDFLKGQGHI